MNKRHAFTLIEMLVVIAIIGIVAAMVVNGISHANYLKKKALIDAQKQSLMLMIDNYQSKLNFYPPDNGYLATAIPATYDGYAATNPLLYELTGGTNINGTYLFDGVPYVEHYYSSTFNRPTVANSNPDEPHNFFNPAPQPKSYTNYAVPTSLVPSNNWFHGLLVPVPLSESPAFHNYWHYDSSSTNRHNLQSYDLWAEYISSSKNGVDIIATNGNW